MKRFASIWFDDVITVAQGKSNGAGEPRQNLQELSFHAPEWEIWELERGLVQLFTEGMPKPAKFEGYPYGYTDFDEPEPKTHPVTDETRAVNDSPELMAAMVAANAEAAKVNTRRGKR